MDWSEFRGHDPVDGPPPSTYNRAVAESRRDSVVRTSGAPGKRSGWSGGRRTGPRGALAVILSLLLTGAAAASQLGASEALELLKLERQGEYARKRAQCDQARLQKDLERAIRCLDELIVMGYDELLQPNVLQPQDVKLLEELRAEREKQLEEERKRQAAREQFQRVFDQARRARAAGNYRSAKTLMEDALKRNPAAARDPEFARELNLAQADYRDYIARLAVIWGFVGLFATGAGVALVRAMRKGRASSASLEMLEGGQPGEVFTVVKERVIVGTSPTDADIQIVDLSRRVSRLHCEIARRGSRYYVTDLSSNGTTVNGQPLDRGQPRLLRAGDVIGLAPDVTLRFGA